MTNSPPVPPRPETAEAWAKERACGECGVTCSLDLRECHKYRTLLGERRLALKTAPRCGPVQVLGWKPLLAREREWDEEGIWHYRDHWWAFGSRLWTTEWDHVFYG
jgi:hypothetical protein